MSESDSHWQHCQTVNFRLVWSLDSGPTRKPQIKPVTCNWQYVGTRWPWADFSSLLCTSMAKDDDSKPLEPSGFAAIQLKLLEEERRVEVAEVSDAITTFSPTQLQTRGLALINLVISSVRIGLGGKTYISALCCRWRAKTNRLGEGYVYGRNNALARDSYRRYMSPSASIVRLFEKERSYGREKNGSWRCDFQSQGKYYHFVTSGWWRNSFWIWSAMLAVRQANNLGWFSVKLANEATFKRMCDTMERLRDTPTDKLSPLANILLGRSAPTKVDKLDDIKFIDETLNDSQRDAVSFSLSAAELALIHGPPGVPTLPEFV